MKIKATNLELTLHLHKRNFKIRKIVEGIKDGKFVADWEPKTKNISICVNDGEWIRQGKVTIKTGDILSVHCHSGSWTGMVYQIFKTNQHRKIPFTSEGEIFMLVQDVTLYAWKGIFTEPEYGISEFGYWKVNDGFIKETVDGINGMVETPEYPDLIPWNIYLYASRLSDYLFYYYFPNPEERKETFRQIIAFLMDLKAEIDAKEMLEKL